jgi:trk system potassium uptake protein TrkA
MEVDDIINLEEEMGKMIAQTLASANLGRFIPLSEGHSIAEIKIPDSYIGKTLRQINPREKYKVNVVALKKFVPAIDDTGERTMEEMIDNVPSSDEKLEDDTVLLVAGANRDIEKFSKG